MTKIDDAIKDLEQAIEENHIDKVLSKLCGDFDRHDWTPEALAMTFDKVANAFGSREDAEIFILYLFGWMLAKGKIEVCKFTDVEIDLGNGEKDYDSESVILYSADDPKDCLFEENHIGVGSLSFELTRNA